MSDNKLTTKHRPSTLEEVLGQAHIVKSLSGVLKRSSSQTFLFHGPSGCGKTTLSRICATVVGCIPRNVREIDGATFTGIDDMREITAALSYKPMGGGKVAIIVDECHRLSGQAWDSILKATEEPPAWCFWFFCTTQFGRVPETIRTRSASYELKKVQRDDLITLLKRVSKKESFFTDNENGPGIIELCAKEANGSPRQALQNLSTCVDADDRQEAAKLLKAASESGDAITLARALVDDQPWMKIVQIIGAMKDQNPESIRHVVRAYLTTMVLKANSERRAGRLMTILARFDTPFPTGDGITPVLMACGHVKLT